MNRRLSVLFITVSVLFSVLALSSCSESETSVTGVTASCVFSYETADSNPEMWLSVYVQTADDVRRLESMTLTSRKAGYKWMIDPPVFIGAGSRRWAGFSKVLPAQNDVLFSGLYDIEITDASGNEDSSSFMVSYPEELLNSTAGEIRNYVKVNLSEYIILYDSNETMVYYGRRKSIWKTDENILRDYNRAETKRLCLSSSSGNLLFLLPPEILGEETADVQSE